MQHSLLKEYVRKMILTEAIYSRDAASESLFDTIVHEYYACCATASFDDENVGYGDPGDMSLLETLFKSSIFEGGSNKIYELLSDVFFMEKADASIISFNHVYVHLMGTGHDEFGSFGQLLAELIDISLFRNIEGLRDVFHNVQPDEIIVSYWMGGNAALFAISRAQLATIVNIADGSCEKFIIMLHRLKKRHIWDALIARNNQ